MNPAPWITDPRAWSLDGRIYRVTRPGPEFGPLVVGDPVWMLINTLALSTDREHLVEVILASELSERIVHAVTDALVERWCGWPQYKAERIWRQTLEAWQVTDAHLLTHGTDILELPPDRATNLAYGVLAERHAGDKDHGERWRRDLNYIPPKVVKQQQPDREAEARDWRAMQSIFAGMST